MTTENADGRKSPAGSWRDILVIILAILVLMAIGLFLTAYLSPVAHPPFASKCGEFGTWTQYDAVKNMTTTWTGRLVCT